MTKRLIRSEKISIIIYFADRYDRMTKNRFATNRVLNDITQSPMKGMTYGLGGHSYTRPY